MPARDARGRGLPKYAGLERGVVQELVAPEDEHRVPGGHGQGQAMRDFGITGRSTRWHAGSNRSHADRRQAAEPRPTERRPVLVVLAGEHAHALLAIAPGPIARPRHE